MTGHLVLSTLHTNDAPTAIPRFIDMGGEPFLVANTLTSSSPSGSCAAFAQSAFQAMRPPKKQKTMKKQLALYHADPARIKIPSQRYKGKDVRHAQTPATRDRSALFEVLNVTPRIRELIKPLPSIHYAR